MAKNLFESSSENFISIIGSGKHYQVPDYQRNYSWKVEHWTDLWEDMILSAEKKEEHYMGAIVLQQSDRKMTIIDGQQRITTLSLFVLAAIKFLNQLIKEGKESKKNEERIQVIRRKFLGDIDAVSLSPWSKLQLNEKDNGFYQSTLMNGEIPPVPSKLSDSEKLLWNCQEYFLQQISRRFSKDNGESISSFLENDVAEKLTFIQIVVQDNSSAYTIFETLNARGVDLTNADLLKNYLFSIVSNSPADLKRAKSYWNKIVDTISLKTFPEFLRHYLNSKNKLTKTREVFSVLKKVVHSEKILALGLLKDLHDLSFLYAALSRPDDEFWIDQSIWGTDGTAQKERVKHIRELKLFGIKNIRPLLLASFSGSKTEFTKLLKMCSVIAFRYHKIADNDSKVPEEVYSEIAKEISEKGFSSAKSVFDKIKGKLYISDEKIEKISKIIEFKYKGQNKKLVKYILEKIDKNLDEQKTVEHILPESFNSKSGWKKYFESKNIHDQYSSKLGNYLLLESTINKEVGNQEWKDKKKLYKKSKYEVVKKLSEISLWNKSTIEKRQEILAKEIVKNWRIDW